MVIYPAIDLYEGKVVRLEKGCFEKLTVYSKEPAAVARQWCEAGAEWLHLVDLEGAKTGTLKNFPKVLEIRKAVSCSIQFGGGLRTIEEIENVLESGINRVVLGTKALDPEFCRQALGRFGKQIAVALDMREGRIQTQGWLEASDVSIEEALNSLNNFPIQTMIYTDIQKDGMLTGPNFNQLEKILQATRARVILSGGIGSLEDLQQCQKISNNNFDGVIIGKALYEKKFSLPDALLLSRS